jgi:hypothetical protein
MNKALKNGEITKAIGKSQGGFSPNGHLCPTCLEVYGFHSGNCCKRHGFDFDTGDSRQAEADGKFWPIENLLKIEKENGNVYKLDEILGFLFFKRDQQ